MLNMMSTIKSGLKRYSLKLKLRERIDEILIWYRLHYDISVLNDSFKSDFTSWDDLRYFVYPRSALPSLTTYAALSLNLKIDAFWLKVRTQFMQAFSYPTVLLVLSVVMMFVFRQTIYPQMFDLLLSFNITEDELGVVMKVFGLLLMTLAIVGILVLILLVGYRRQRVWYWIGATRYSRFLKQVMTHYLALHMKSLRDNNISWDEVVEGLLSFENRMVRWLVYHMKGRLEKGEQIHEVFTETYVDCLLIHMLKQCHFGKDMDDVIEEYLDASLSLIDIRWKRIVRHVKIVSYCFVCVTVIGYYTALMIPMRLMEGL